MSLLPRPEMRRQKYFTHRGLAVLTCSLIVKIVTSFWFVCVCVCVFVCVCVCVCVSNANPLYCTCFVFRAMRIHGVSVIYFRFTHLLGGSRYKGNVHGMCIIYWKQARLGCLGCMCNCRTVWYIEWWWGMGEGEIRCRHVAYLFLSISIKGTARLKITMRRANHYQQYNMLSKHM